MANPWFRLYAEFAHDPKVQMLSEAMQRRYVMLLCIRCGSDDVTFQDESIAFQLRVSMNDWLETKALFVDRGLIDEQNQIIAWDRRQFLSDSSADRVRRHREKRKSAGLPAQQQISPVLRKQVFERDGHQCVFCGAADDLTIDHMTPEMYGGTNEPDNLQTACRPCNASKRDLTDADFRKRKGIGQVTLPKRPQITEAEAEAEQKTPKPPRGAGVKPPKGFESFWAAYPRKEGKLAAVKAFERAVKLVEHPVPTEALTEAALAYAKACTGKDPQYIAHPTTWLNQGRWADVPATPADPRQQALASGTWNGRPLTPTERYMLEKNPSYLPMAAGGG